MPARPHAALPLATPAAPPIRDVRPLREAVDDAHAAVIAAWQAQLDARGYGPPDAARAASEASARAAERVLLGHRRASVW